MPCRCPAVNLLQILNGRSQNEIWANHARPDIADRFCGGIDHWIHLIFTHALPRAFPDNWQLGVDALGG